MVDYSGFVWERPCVTAINQLIFSSTILLISYYREGEVFTGDLDELGPARTFTGAKCFKVLT